VMSSVEVTLARADTALIAAESAFDGANSVIVDDMPGIISGLNSTIASLGRSAAGVESFSRNGLPQFGTFATEARALVASLSALTNRIASDPGRFLLGNQTPDYRR